MAVAVVSNIFPLCYFVIHFSKFPSVNMYSFYNRKCKAIKKKKKTAWHILIHDKVKRTSVEIVLSVCLSIVPEARDANDTKKTTGRGEVWRETQCIQYKIEFEVDDSRTKKSMSAEDTKGAISTSRPLLLKQKIIVSNDL